MDFEAVCRTCLGTKSLNPIFKNKKHHDRFSMAMINTTGLKVELHDGLPQNICIDCMALINEALKFRARCKDSETKLLLMRNGNAVFVDTLHSDYEKDGDEIISNSKSQVKTEDYIKIESLANSDDEKPLQYLTDNQIENNDYDNSITDDFIHNNATILDNDHLDINKKQNNKECSNLDTEFITKIDKKQTISNKTNKKVTELNGKQDKVRVTCRVCTKSLSVRSVDAHMSKRHPGADERKAQCKFCERYVLKEKMNRHLTLMHGKDCCVCAYCKLEFPTKETLLEHVASCSDKKRKRNTIDTGKEMSECEVCHKKMQKASLKMHQRIKHAGLGPVCDHCDRKFGNKFRLNEHLRSKHGYEKFKCALCDFQSAGLMALRNHERRHRGEKPFVCERCGARFHAAYLLAQHNQSHRTQKLLKCDLCPASFKANNSLHMHKKTCHSSTSYKCSLCARAYSCRHYVVKHLRSVHRYIGPVPSLDKEPAS